MPSGITSLEATASAATEHTAAAKRWRCRNKREDILQSATSAREGLQRRISEQEVTAEQRLHELDIKLRVGAALLHDRAILQLPLEVSGFVLSDWAHRSTTQRPTGCSSSR